MQKHDPESANPVPHDGIRPRSGVPVKLHVQGTVGDAVAIDQDTARAKAADGMRAAGFGGWRHLVDCLLLAGEDPRLPTEISAITSTVIRRTWPTWPVRCDLAVQDATSMSKKLCDL